MNLFKTFSICLVLLCHAALAEEKPAAFTGVDYSGAYDCKGNNISVGDYEVSIILKLNRRNSHGHYGVYDFISETENKETYTGQTIATGNTMALTFKLISAKNSDFSTGVGEFKKFGRWRWAFTNSYYEPDDTGGNYGQERCVMKISLAKTIKARPKKLTRSL